MSDYLTVTCRLPADAEATVAEALERWPVLGCQVEDVGREIAVTIYVEQAQEKVVPLVLEELRWLGAADLASAHFADEDWLSEYRRHATPCAIGRRFWIDPHPGAPTPPPEGRIHLVIEPRQAFGTGSHESTQLVLLLLEDLPLAGARVLDVGTGSAILAIAAGRLGAVRAVGFDIDLDAVFVARQTVDAQPCPAGVELYAGPVEALRAAGRFDVILANMIPAQIEPLLAALRLLLAPGGTLVLSGLLADQRTAMESELGELGFSATATRGLGEWTALLCRPR